VAVVALPSSLLALFGCDGDRIARLEEGVWTEAEVRRAFGEPAASVTEDPRDTAGGPGG
jgi:hypothetical protein